MCLCMKFFCIYVNVPPRPHKFYAYINFMSTTPQRKRQLLKCQLSIALFLPITFCFLLASSAYVLFIVVMRWGTEESHVLIIKVTLKIATTRDGMQS